MGFRTWFSLEGRISRLTWCIFYFLISNGIIFAASILDARVLPKNSMPAALGKGMGELSVVSALALLLGLWLSLAGQVKRWHDQDRTGWWGCLTTIPNFIVTWFLFFIEGDAKIYLIGQIVFPLAFMFFSVLGFSGPNINRFLVEGMNLVSFSLLLLWVLFFVNGSFLPGTRGPNRFGPDPLAPKDADKNTATATFRETGLRKGLALIPSHRPDQKKSEGNLISLTQWFSFNGRISRNTWWIFYFLIPISINIVASAMDAMILSPKNALPDKSGIGDANMGAYSIIAALASIWIALAGQAKRWHDRDKSGWWVLVNFIPLIGWLWAFIVAGFLRGTPGPNRFGPDPLAPPDTTNIAPPPQPQ